MADVYLSSANKGTNTTDKIYENGASKFIGEAIKYYAENSK
ncbi:hypothetical protein [Clostridium sp. 19966]|nr:hypothetical protein [Clostridium sp. 19966]